MARKASGWRERVWRGCGGGSKPATWRDQTRVLAPHSAGVTRAATFLQPATHAAPHPRPHTAHRICTYMEHDSPSNPSNSESQR